MSIPQSRIAIVEQKVTKTADVVEGHSKKLQDLTENVDKLRRDTEQLPVLSEGVNQLRRAFGFNGKLKDPEAEVLLAETFGQMRELAQARREEIKLEVARALVLEDYRRRVRRFQPILKAAKWTGIAVISAGLLQIGILTVNTVQRYLHLHHLLGQ